MISDQIPYWSRSTVPPEPEKIVSEKLNVELAFGWPAITSVYEVHAAYDLEATRPLVFDRISSGLPIRPVRMSTIPFICSLTWSKAYALPLKPILHGLLINTLFYAVILWLHISGPFMLRRFLRCKRGLCVKCAYDMKGAEHVLCPECGHQLATAFQGK